MSNSFTIALGVLAAVFTHFVLESSSAGSRYNVVNVIFTDYC